jgi:hypothetical protein
MIARLAAAIQECDPDATSTEVADALWLAGFLTPPAPDTAAASPEPPQAGDRPAEVPSSGKKAEVLSKPLPRKERRQPRQFVDEASFHLPGAQQVDAPRSLAARSPAVPAIPNQLALSRALRPLGRKALSRKKTDPDERRTAERIADTGIWVPSIRPRLERWLDVALVVDSSASMAVWDQTVSELRGLLERTGMFRDVRHWHLDGDNTGGPTLLHSELGRNRAGRDPAELIDPGGRRLILVVTDCVGHAWANGSIGQVLERWAHSGLVAMVQLLPQRLWVDCAPEFVPVRMHSPAPGAPNTRWSVQRLDVFGHDHRITGVPIPVVQLETRWLSRWASLVAGTTAGWIQGTAVLTGEMATVDFSVPEQIPHIAPVDRVRRFRARASHQAYQLAVYLSGAPLSLPVMRLVQQAMFPESKPSHLAEVFLSDLLHSTTPAYRIRNLNADEIEYDFLPGIRGELLGQLTRTDALQVLSKVSNFVSKRLGSPNDFPALLTLGDRAADNLGRPFAKVAENVLRSLGGRYADVARRLHQKGEGLHNVQDARSQTNPTLTGSRDLDGAHGADLSKTGHPPTVDDSRRSVTEPDALEPAIMRDVPQRNPHFTGRGDMLDKLHSMLVGSSQKMALLPHTLHGLGGVGKTQLAVEYVYRYSHTYDLICWISAENPDQVRTSLAKLGGTMRLPESVDVSQTADSVLDALRTRQPFRNWLLVFDNADDPDDIRGFLPVPTGHVLITSRNTSWTEVAATLEVDVLHRSESIELLQRRGRAISANDAEELAERLGDLPLALEQAAAWQAETGMTVREYLDLFDNRLQTLTDDPPANYPATLGATWQLSFDRLRTQSPDAAQLLEMCAFLGSEPIPFTLLWAGRYAELPAELATTMRDTVRLRRALREINRYALGKLTPAGDRMSIHRLVQAVLRATMAPHTHEIMKRSARRLLSTANPAEPDNTDSWPMHEQLSPHIVPSGVIESGDEQTRKVVLDQIRYRYARGDYEGSRDLGEIVVELWQRKWGLEDLWTLIARRHLANTLRVLGFSERAYDLNVVTLEKMRETLGPDDEHTLATADTFAADLRRRGLFNQAKESDEDNLARFLVVFGEQDHNTARVRNNLAVNYRLLGDAKGAMELDQDNVRRLREIFGSEHQRTLFSISNMVRDMIGLGQYAEALQKQQESLPAHEQLLGPLHGDVLLAKRNIVIALRKTGSYQSAVTAALAHSERCRQRLGPNHEHTLAAMTSYGNALRDAGDLSAARQVLADAFDRYSETLLPKHPFTLACAINLAIVFRLEGEFKAALSMNERTRAALTEALDANHPAVLCCSANLSNDLAGLHEHERALQVSQATFAASIEVRGDKHPYTLMCAINAALDLQATGQQEAGQLAFADALTELRALLGRDHPEVWAIEQGKRANCDIEVSPT